jgi:hypothetical protein
MKVSETDKLKFMYRVLAIAGIIPVIGFAIFVYMTDIQYPVDIPIALYTISAFCLAAAAYCVGKYNGITKEKLRL